MTPFRPTLLASAAAAVLLASALPAQAGDPAPVALPSPQKEGGKPLMQALSLRSTARAFAPDPIPLQTLSNLLWAAWGINRPDGKRTAPSARNWQEIEVVVIRSDGAFTYDAAANSLRPLATGDLRPLAGVQEFVKEAPVTLVLVADRDKMKGAPEGDDSWAWADAGFVSQNAYLYCASEGLATGVRAMIDRPALAKALGLSPRKVILLAQSVGFPKR